MISTNLKAGETEKGTIKIKYITKEKEHDFNITSKKKKITRIMQSIYYTRYLIYLQRC